MPGLHNNQVVAFDVMGGDGGVPSMVRGLCLAVKLFPDELGEIILVGDAPTISDELALHKNLSKANFIKIIHASQAVSMTEKPMHALRNKKDASMFKSIDLLKQGEVSGVLSCGNTGCLVAGGILKLRTMSGVSRPALATVIPAPANHFVLIDVGATPSSSYENLIHNAVLGSLYYGAAVASDKRPRVGLLTIGTEEGKGIDVVRNAHAGLKKIDGIINYCGLIEGFQLFSNEVDVVVCDGFVGNILLKTIEALAGTIKNYVKVEMKKNFLRMFGAMLASGAFRAMKRDLTADRYGGAPLLGLNGIVVKSHGSSSDEAVAHALRLTFRLAQRTNDHCFSDAIERVNAMLD